VSECSHVINFLLKSDAPLTCFHLDIAVKHRHFALAIRVLNRGIDSPNLSSILAGHLSSPNSLDADFDVFLFACVLFEANISGLLNAISTFPTIHIPHIAIALIPLLIASPSPSLSNFGALFAGESNRALLPYAFARQEVIQLTQRLEAAKMAAFESVSPVLSLPAVYATLSKFATDLTTQVKDRGVRRLPSDVTDFKSFLSDDIHKIERYFLSTLLEPMQAVNSLVAEGKRIHATVGRYASAVDFLKYSVFSLPLSETVGRLKGACVAHALGQRIDPTGFRTTLSTLQFLAAYLAFARDPSAASLVPAFIDSVSGLAESFARDVPLWDRVLAQPSGLHARLTDPSGPLFRSVRQVGDALLFALYFIEAGKLETSVKCESLTYASATSKALQFPDWSQVFTRFATQDLLAQVTQARAARDQLFQFAVDRISAFFQKTRALPGSRQDLRYVDFEPARPWPWPAVPNCPFPVTPAEVREVLQLRGALQRGLEEYILSQSTPFCERCKEGIACTVCPKCRRLVLCNMCRDQTLRCPREGCDVTFEPRSRVRK
jgi:hypothetical protein